MTPPHRPAASGASSSTGCATRPTSIGTCASTPPRCASTASRSSAIASARERRLLAHREDFIRGAVSTENCLNCGEVLKGQHCSHCGQRAKVRVLSLDGPAARPARRPGGFRFTHLAHAVPLAFRPGLLTSEYLRGRRTYYTPPFRMYLTLSVVFFLVTSLGSSPGDDFTVEPRRPGRWQPADCGRSRRRCVHGRRHAAPAKPAAGVTPRPRIESSQPTAPR